MSLLSKRRSWPCFKLHDFPSEIEAGIRDEEVRAAWQQQNESLINSLETALRYVKEQKLFGKM